MRRIDQITPVDENSSKMAWEKIDQLTKPIGSLGKIEEYAAQLAAISGKMSQALEKSGYVCLRQIMGFMTAKLRWFLKR